MFVFTDPIRHAGSWRTIATENPAEGRRFDRIAHRRSGAVRLDVDDARGQDAGLSIRVLEHRRLSVDAGDRHGGRMPVLVDGGAAHHCVDAVAIGQRGGQRFEVNERRTFGANESVRARVEREALAGWRDHRRLAEPHACLGADQRVDTAGKGACRLAGPDALARGRYRHERRRAGGIERDAGSLQIEQVRDAVGCDARGRAAVRVCVDILGASQLEAAVVVARNADEHPDPPSA